MISAKAVSIAAELLEAPLTLPMKIARESATDTSIRTVIVHANDGERTGIGESAPIPRYNETVESVLSYYADHYRNPVALRDFDTFLAPLPNAARCGLDIAIHDLLGRRLGAPLWQLFGLDAAAIPATSFTLYINDVATTVAQARELRNFPILKIKLGLGNELETISSVRDVYTGTIRVDANEGWSPEQTVAFLNEMEKYQIEFCEQPIPAGSPETLRWIRERSAIPIVVDEDSVTASSLGRLIGCVDGVNIKLAKCGGLRAGLEMIHTARALGFKTMLGCMGESSVLITAAGHIAPLVDWVDLDGNLLMKGDPYEGMLFENGRLTLPNRPGLGIVSRNPLE